MKMEWEIVKDHTQLFINFDEEPEPVQFSELEDASSPSFWVYTDSTSPTAIRVVLQELGTRSP